MQIVIGNVLSADEVALVRETLAQATLRGRPRDRGLRGAAGEEQPAGGERPQDRDGPQAGRPSASSATRCSALAVRPKALTSVMFSRYETGMDYGSHVDDALMDGMRTDVSFTLFLSDPESYDGGELVIESASGEDAVKLAAGSLVAYPSTTLHHVAPITRGVRLAAVGWARSFVRDGAQREMLFDLDTARRQLFAREGKSAEYDLVSKSLANLLRMWVED